MLYVLDQSYIIPVKMFPEFKKSKVESIELWKDYIISEIKLAMKRKGKYEAHLYMYFADTMEAKVYNVNTFMEDDRSKDHLSWILKVVAMGTKPDGIIFASEGWMYREQYEDKAQGKKDIREEAYKYGNIEDHPEKMEVIFVNYEDQSKAIGHIYHTRRDKKGRYVRLDEMENSGTVELAGRFAQFIKGKPTLDLN